MDRNRSSSPRRAKKSRRSSPADTRVSAVDPGEAPKTFEKTEGHVINDVVFSDPDSQPVFDRRKANGVEIVKADPLPESSRLRVVDEHTHSH